MGCDPPAPCFTSVWGRGVHCEQANKNSPRFGCACQHFDDWRAHANPANGASNESVRLHDPGRAVDERAH